MARSIVYLSHKAAKKADPAYEEPVFLIKASETCFYLTKAVWEYDATAPRVDDDEFAEAIEKIKQHLSRKSAQLIAVKVSEEDAGRLSMMEGGKPPSKPHPLDG